MMQTTRDVGAVTRISFGSELDVLIPGAYKRNHAKLCTTTSRN